MIKVWTDGSCRANGTKDAIAAIGYVAVKDETELFRDGKLVDYTTNNEAEYSAIMNVLQRLVENKDELIWIYCDSALVVNQLNGAWKVKDDRMLFLRNMIQGFIYTQKFKEVRFTWIPREQNKIANDIAQALTEKRR